MRKFIIIAVMSVLAMVLFVGCTQTPAELPTNDAIDSQMPANGEDVDEYIVVEDVDSNTEMDEDDSIEKVSGYIDISPQDAKELIDSMPDLVIIDVSPKYDEGHLPGSVNYYVGDGSLDEAIPSLDKTKTYLVYCHVDSASISGAQKLVDAGFENVYRLEGNYSARVDAGYEIEK